MGPRAHSPRSCRAKHDNYDTDLFPDLIGASVELTRGEGRGWAKFSTASLPIICAASVPFLMADGVSPSNEGRGYVLAPDHAPRDAPPRIC